MNEEQNKRLAAIEAKLDAITKWLGIEKAAEIVVKKAKPSYRNSIIRNSIKNPKA